MALSAGDRIGPYEIAGLIGTGGMGEVYRAHDPRLDREVAIKVLPPALAADRERLARFEREARVLAALHHPNIAAIYGLEDTPTHAPAIVMALVEGPTLADRLTAGRLPQDEALAVARQLAEALEAAHDKGIIHRDLKPANVKISPDGHVTVLDFGLATAVHAAASRAGDPAESPTLTIGATQAGVILGTAGYMAPEQAAGRPLDKRADIWAFGVVLWEMLTGERLFAATESTPHVLADVLRAPIDFEKIPGGPLRELVRRCLDRDVKTRLRDIGEARVTLSGPLTSRAVPPGAEAGAATAAGASTATVAWAVAAAALAVVSGLALWAPWRVEPDRPLVRLEVDLGADVALPALGRKQNVVLSPDGTRLAYIASVSGDPSRLYIRRLDDDTPMELPGTEGAIEAAFSPDSRSVAFVTPTGAHRVSVEGGAAMRLAETALGNVTWGIDGSILLSGEGGGLQRVSSGGGEPVHLTKLSKVDSFHTRPHVLPGGRAILFAAGGPTRDITSIEAVSPSGSDRKTVIPSGVAPWYLPSGHLLYLIQNTLFAVRFDPDRLETRGDAVPMVTDVKTTTLGGLPVQIGTFSVAGNGTLVYRKATGPTATAQGTARVDVIDAAGRRSPLIAISGAYFHLRFSPDGGQVALTVRQSERSDVWVYHPARGSMTRQSFEGGLEPVWSRPDGRYLLFQGRGGIFWTRPGSGAQPQRLLSEPATMAWSFAPDGKRLAYVHRSVDEGVTARGARIFTAPLTEEGGTLKAGTPEPFSPGDDEAEAEFSPDGRWIAFSTARSGQREVMVRAFPPPASGQAFEVQVSNNGGTEPRWSQTGRELLYVEGDQLMAVAYTVNGETFLPQRPRVRVEKLGSKEWDLAPDGRIAVVTPIETGPGGASQAPAAEHTVVFLQNFDAEVSRRVK